MVDVDPQELAEERLEALGTVARVAGAAAVARPDVEVAVGAEGEHPAVVVRERLADPQEHRRRSVSARFGSVAERWYWAMTIWPLRSV